MGEVILISALLAIPGLALIYFGLAGAVGCTQIHADRNSVRQWTGPLPWSRPLAYPVQGLKQFFAQGRTLSKSSATVSFGSVFLIDADEHVHMLAQSLPSPFAANQICHTLEDFYGIEDLPVYGVTTNPSHPGPRV